MYEQRNSNKGITGYRKNLIMFRCVCKDAKFYQRYLSTAWIDYQKAFDSASHRLIVCLLGSLMVYPHMVRCIERLLPLWKTRFTMSFKKHRVTTNSITFPRCILQGIPWALSSLAIHYCHYFAHFLLLSTSNRNSQWYSYGKTWMSKAYSHSCLEWSLGNKNNLTFIWS